MNTAAVYISSIFDPFIMLAVVHIVLLSGSPVFIPAFISMVVVPFVLFVIAWKTKFISNWDVTNRQERPKLFWPLIAVETISIMVFRLWIILPLIASMIGFALITHVWKISGHAYAAGLAAGIVIWQFGWQWWPVLFIVPLVAWGRVVTNNHTLLHVIAGAVYAWFSVLFMV